MAIGIYFGGRRLVRPQAATEIDDTGMYARGIAGANVLALIGESTGGEPGKVLWFTDPAHAKSILRGGDLLTAIQKAYDPSAEVPGAYLIAAVRVNPATKASLVLRSLSGKPLIKLESVDWGAWNNQIKVRIQSGTLKGKKVTVAWDTMYDVGDNIAKDSVYVVLAQAKARSGIASVSTTNKVMTVSVVANAQKVFLYHSESYTDITNAAKEDDTDYFSVALETSDYIYIGSERMFNAVDFGPGETVQSNWATLSGEYWDGSAWTALPNFTDGTSSGGVPFAQVGKISWYGTAGDSSTYPSGWMKTMVNNVEQYWVRIKTSTQLSSGAQGDWLWPNWGVKADLSTYETVGLLTSYLDSEIGLESGLLTTNPGDKSLEMDDVSEVSMIQTRTTLTASYTGGTKLQVSSITGFSVGNRIAIASVDGSKEEVRRITALATGQITIDSELGGNYAVGDVVTKGVVFTSNLQAVIDWFNEGNTSLVTASFSDEATGREELSNIGYTFLSGGSEGTTTQSDWDRALDLLKTEEVHLISCVSHEPSVWASLSAHCSYMSTVGKKERIGFCGGFSSLDGYTDGLGKWSNTAQINASIERMLEYARELNSDRMVYVGPGFVGYDDQGVKRTYSGAIAAAMVAGMAAGVDVAESLTHKSVKVLGLEYKFRWSDLDRLLLGGVCPLEYDPGTGYRVCQSITTWLRNDRYNRRELSVRRVADFVARQVRERLEQDFVGKKGTMTTLISIKNATVSVLTQCYRAQLLAGNEENPPFKNVQCRLEGDTVWVDFECSPVIPVNYIPVTVHLTVFTATLTA